MRRSLLTLSAFLVPATLAACLPKSSTGPTHALFYAVVYGHVTAPMNTFRITVQGEAYTSKDSALKRDSLFGGFTPTIVDANSNYFIALSTARPMTLYFNIEGSGQNGPKVLNDTVHAIAVRFDSIGGGPHDSIAVGLHLH